MRIDLTDNRIPVLKHYFQLLSPPLNFVLKQKRTVISIKTSITVLSWLEHILLSISFILPIFAFKMSTKAKREQKT